MTTHVFVADAKRTPIGSFQGSLAHLAAPQLGAHAITALQPEAIDEVIMGNVVSAGLRQAPARQAMRLAGIADSCGATTINKVCGSGMKATMVGTDIIKAGSAQRVLVGGMESMSNMPYLLAKARGGLRMGHADLQDSMFTDGLEDAETGRAMGTFAQQTADDYQLTREAMDAYAVESVTRARTAIEAGSLRAEIEPIETPAGTVADDEQPGRAKLDKIPQLRPAFKADGTITAANASSISDGASALVLASEDQLRGQEPLARVAGHTAFSRHPSDFTLAPIGAINNLLAQLEWDANQVDLFEINEAFAMVTMLCISELQLDPAKVNVYGGACAQGHPIGSTGSRLIVTLAHAMRAQGARRGIAALCIGGGEATAIALTRD